MKKAEALRKIEQTIQDMNYYINSKSSDEKKMYAWQYTREYLQIIYKIVSAIDESGD